jgi:hypothetical protein
VAEDHRAGDRPRSDSSSRHLTNVPFAIDRSAGLQGCASGLRALRPFRSPGFGTRSRSGPTSRRQTGARLRARRGSRTSRTMRAKAAPLTAACPRSLFVCQEISAGPMAEARRTARPAGASATTGCLGRHHRPAGSGAADRAVRSGAYGVDLRQHLDPACCAPRARGAGVAWTG